jgi:hypothetical protein
MTKVKVKVVGAYVDGHAPGSTISIDKKSAEYLEKVGYIRVLEEEKPKEQPKPKEEEKPVPKKTPAKKKNK